MFIVGGLFLELSKDIYRARFLFNPIPAPIRYAVSLILSHIIMNYLGIFALILVTSEKVLNFCYATNFAGLIVIVVFLIIEKSFGMVKLA